MTQIRTEQPILDVIEDEAALSSSEPTRVLVVGCGEVAVALAKLARVLDWPCRIVERLTATDELRPGDAMIVISHDVEIAGPALSRALQDGLFYVGGMGSRTTQRRRHDWLVDHQISPLQVRDIYGPAGLDIGAEVPTEIALSIMAEVAAVRHQVLGGSISRRPGPIHTGPIHTGPTHTGPNAVDCPGG